MPAHRQPAAMTSDEFRAILEATGATPLQTSARLGVTITTVYRWLNDETPISQAKAQLIRERLEPKGE